MTKVVVISPYAGKTERGAENLAFYLKKKLPFETIVLSCYDSWWTKKVSCKYFSFWHRFITLTKTTHFYRFLYQIDKIVYYFDVFADNFFDLISFSKKALIEIDQIKPDIIINIAGSTVGYYLRKYRSYRNIPFITVYGAGKNITEVKNARTNPDVYVAQTPSVVRFIRSRVKNVKVSLIPIGAELEEYNNAKPLSMDELLSIRKNFFCSRIEISRPIILSTSALEKQKRLDFLIKAVAKLNKGTLIFTSDGTKRNYLINLSKKLLKNRFIYLGVVDKKLLPRVYKTCDVFCLPSINEPFGNVFIEAMAANKPVVADNDEDRRWIVGEAGVLTDVRDVNKIADAIWKAYNTDWKTIPLQQAKKFSWDQIIKEYKNLIEKVIREKKLCQW